MLGASDLAELLETTVPAVNSSPQRARAALAKRGLSLADRQAPLSPAHRELLERYAAAFERYDIQGLTVLSREDAIQSMPPYDMWLAGREDIFAWWLGPRIGCRGADPPHGRRERPARLRPVQAEPCRRLRALGAAGARALWRAHRRAHPPLEVRKSSLAHDWNRPSG